MAKNAYLQTFSRTGRRRRNGFHDLVRRIFGTLDPVIFGCTLFLSLFSILTLYGGIENFGKSRLLMQIGMTALGILLMTVISHIDYRFIVNRYWLLFVIFSAGILVYTAVFGNVEGGNRSWLTVLEIGDFDITIQPSEFIKLFFICSFARHLVITGQKINRPASLALLFLHAGVVLCAILISGDLGVMLVYCGITLFMLYAAGMSLFYDLGIFCILVVLFPYLWDFLAEYQQERILVGFNPMLDPLGKGYQPLLSRDAILSGGWFGEGVFGGEIYCELPASHTDFMFATVCEKFGFFGGLAVLVALVVLVLRILYLALRMRDPLGKWISVGIASMLVVQSIENVGMCLAKLPVVGITLPFISYGGSSMLAIYLLFGVMHSVSSHGK